MSLRIGPNSLLLVPAGFDPATVFGSYSLDPASLMHTVGTPFTILPGQGFAGVGTIADFVNCQGSVSAVWTGTIEFRVASRFPGRAMSVWVLGVLP